MKSHLLALGHIWVFYLEGLSCINIEHVIYFSVWSDRYKQILKKWRTLSNDQKAPYLQHARDNRSAQRMKKAQQVTIVKTCTGA